MQPHDRGWPMFAGAVLALSAPASIAQGYPAKPMRLIVGFAPGGPNDIVARVVGQKLAESLGVPVTVDNRPGADSVIGTQLLARSAPDGYTLSVISASSTIHPAVYANVPFDIVKDFSHVALLASTAFLVVVNPSVPARSLKELVALAKSKPGRLNFASSGTGGSLHLAGELFKAYARVEMTHVPYKGGAPAITDVVGGQVDLMFSPIPVATPHLKSGRVRVLAVTSARRWPTLPEVPTVAESSDPRYEVTGWYGIVAPARTPRAIVTRLNQELVRLLELPDVKQRFAGFDLEPIVATPEQMTSHLEAELAKWAGVVRDAKLPRGQLY